MSDSPRVDAVNLGKASLLDGAVTTSKLGYGTATLMGRISFRGSVRALDTAFAAGITHFDTARAYGYGEAERAVGAFIRNKRDQVTVTTKAGIVPPARSASLSALRVAAKGIVAFAPGLRQTLRRTAAKTVATGRFDSKSIRNSLETSLRELSTDYVDIFLLHECTLADLTDDLFDTLQRFVAEGKIRAYGTATQAHSSREIIENENRFAAVVQLPDSLSYPTRLPSTVKSIITHSVFRGDVNEIAARLPKRDSLASFNLQSAGLARRAMLEYGLRSSRGGITLFSSTNPAHIAENARSAANRLFQNDELDAMVSDIAPARSNSS